MTRGRLHDRDAGHRRPHVLNNLAVPMDLVLEHDRATGTTQRIIYRRDRDELLTLAADPDPALRRVAAGCHQLPLDIRAALPSDPDLDVALLAPASSSVTAEQVRAFAARHGPRVFTPGAAHPCCRPASCSPSPRTRAARRRPWRRSAGTRRPGRGAADLLADPGERRGAGVEPGDAAGRPGRAGHPPRP
nr:hypothetical protein GCM10020063_015250 [Dactylosporangium thailandense]